MTSTRTSHAGARASRAVISAVAVTGLMAGLLVAAVPAQGLPNRFEAGETYPDAMPGPTVFPVQPDWSFGVAFASLESVRRDLIRRGYALDLRITDRSVLVGALSGGRCVRAEAAAVEGPWSWRDAPSMWLASRSWGAAGRGTIRIEQDRGFQAGDRPCVIQQVFWKARGFSGVTFLSRPTPTSTGLPAMLSESLDDATGGPVPGAPEVVLPDIDVPEQEDGDRPALGTVTSFEVNSAAIQRVIDQLIAATNPSIPRPGNPSGGRGQPPRLGSVQIPELSAQERATQEGLRQQAEAAIAAAQESLAAASGDASGSPQEEKLTESVQAASTVVAAVDTQIPIAGGRVPQRLLSYATGVNLVGAPVTGFNGRAKMGRFTLTSKSPRLLPTSKTVTIPVSVMPRTAKGRVTITAVRKTATGVYVAARGSAPLVGGKARVRLRVPSATPKGTYSLVMSYRPTSAQAVGVSAIRRVVIR